MLSQIRTRPLSEALGSEALGCVVYIIETTPIATSITKRQDVSSGQGPYNRFLLLFGLITTIMTPPFASMD
jgi:hypothetical protein